jgi:DMSO/TMAO reductase YedYZ molybdopterin-dependent catalytic subunit
MLVRSAFSLAGLYVGGCDRFKEAPSFGQLLDQGADALTFHSQRFMMHDKALAREFHEADLSPVFKSYGSSKPERAQYQQLLETNFATWQLAVGGLVASPLQLSLAALRRLPARTQITRHDCVDGWSAIGKWTGVTLSSVLRLAGIMPAARYVVFHCADRGEGVEDSYYESLDLVDAFHPQTILAYELNGAPLPVGNGAPLRLRVERQLGYKHAKYLMRVEVVERLDQIADGKGSYWADRGYDWYAGI